MAIVSKDELLKQVKELLKENTSDEAIKFMEDVNDTMDSFGDTNKVSELEKKVTELEEKVKTTDKEWRDRYTERFYSGTDDKKVIDDPSISTPTESDISENTKKTFDDLFSN
jgi:hypothetical protein